MGQRQNPWRTFTPSSPRTYCGGTAHRHKHAHKRGGVHKKTSAHEKAANLYARPGSNEHRKYKSVVGVTAGVPAGVLMTHMPSSPDVGPVSGARRLSGCSAMRIGCHRMKVFFRQDISGMRAQKGHSAITIASFFWTNGVRRGDLTAAPCKAALCRNNNLQGPQTECPYRVQLLRGC